MTTDARAAPPPPASPASPLAPRRRAPRWLWGALIASLALNMLIIGIVGGSLWAVRRGGFWEAPLFLERTHRLMRSLPHERRAQIRAIFRDHKPRLRPIWQEVRAARVRLGELVQGEYSQAQLETALAELGRKEAEAREAARPMLAAMINALSPRERLHFLSVYMPYLDELPSRPETDAQP